MQSIDNGVKVEDKIALIGSGNTFFKDEGIGLYAVKYIKENYDLMPNINILDGGTLGFKLMPLLQEFEHVIIVNTSSDDSTKAGSITIKESEEFIEGSLIKKTANEVEIAEMLQICSLSENMAETTIISIAPEDIISVEVGLSDSIKEALPEFLDNIFQLLKKKGVSVRKREKYCSIEEILYTFANPSIEHGRGF